MISRNFWIEFLCFLHCVELWPQFFVKHLWLWLLPTSFFVDLLVILLNKTQPSILIDKTFLCDFIHLSGNAFKSFLFTFVSADEFLRTQKCANSAVFTNFWLLTVCFHYDNAVKIELLSKFFYDLQKLVADWSNAFRHHDVAKPEKLLKKCREKRSHQQKFHKC